MHVQWGSLSSLLSDETRAAAFGSLQVHLTQSVFEVVLQKSILQQIRQHMLHVSYSKE
jgi:hypothetical protein